MRRNGHDVVHVIDRARCAGGDRLDVLADAVCRHVDPATIGAEFCDARILGGERLQQVTSVSSASKARNNGRWHGSGRDWETPQALFDELDAEFHFTLDPCCHEGTAKCPMFFTEDMNGLWCDWGHEIVFMNPPYGREIPAWTKKAVEASRNGALVVGLLPASTDLAWWHNDVLAAGAEIRYLRGRPWFRCGGKKSHAFQPSVVIVWRPCAVN